MDSLLAGEYERRELATLSSKHSKQRADYFLHFLSPGLHESCGVTSSTCTWDTREVRKLQD